MGRVEWLCVSDRKGEKKASRKSVHFIADRGIGGDAHAGPWHRQVSLLTAEDIESVRQKGMKQLKPGDFAENIVVSGVDLGSLGLGSVLRLGDEVNLSITQIGKVCHAPCAIFYATGDCIMPRQGVFVRVLKGGDVMSGDRVEIMKRISRNSYQAVVLTISDRCSRGEAKDTAGPAIVNMLKEDIHFHIYKTEVIPDDRVKIVERLKHYCDGHSIDLVLTVGGTGFSPNDVTPEAVSEVVDRFTPGLDEAMRLASLRKTPRAMLSRAVSGIRASTLIISLPGSERSATENFGALLPALDHGLAKLRGDPSDCGRGNPESAPEAKPEEKPVRLLIRFGED